MVSEIAINVLPETVYCCSKQCRSFYYNVYCYYCGVFIETHVYAKFRLDLLLRE